MSASAVAAHPSAVAAPAVTYAAQRELLIEAADFRRSFCVVMPLELSKSLLGHKRKLTENTGADQTPAERLERCAEFPIAGLADPSSGGEIQPTFLLAMSRKAVNLASCPVLLCVS